MKHLFSLASSLLLFLAIFLFIWLIVFAPYKPSLIIIVKPLDQETDFQLFYDIGNGFNEKHSIFFTAPAAGTNIVFSMPTDKIHNIRIDPGAGAMNLMIESINFGSHHWSAKEIQNEFIPTHDIREFFEKDDILHVKIDGSDPQFVYNGDFLNVCPSLITLSPTEILFYKVAAYALLAALTIICYLYFRSIDLDSRALKAARSPVYWRFTLTVIFVITIVSPQINNIRNIQPLLPKTENRRMEKPPDIMAVSLNDFPRKYESYFNDNFGFRDFFIRYNNIVRIELLNSTPVQKVMIGKEGWLFFDSDKIPDYDITFKDYRGLAPFSDKQLTQIQHNLEKLRDTLSKFGTSYVITVAPNKNTIYPEYLPDNVVRVHERTRLDRLLAHLSRYSSIRIIDLRDLLRDARKSYPTYYKTDSHWNDYGAFVADEAIMKEISLLRPQFKPLSISDFNISVREIRGRDLAMMLAIPDHFSDNEVEMRLKPSILSDKIGKLVFIHDSYGDNFLPYLSRNFDPIVHLNHYYTLDNILTEKPLVVIHMIAERALDKLLFEKFK